jgi:hypothetical protein
MHAEDFHPKFEALIYTEETVSFSHGIHYVYANIVHVPVEVHQVEKFSINIDRTSLKQ